MSAAVELFRYNDTAQVRVVVVDGEPWFVLADLCKVLDIANVGNAAARVDEAAIRQTDIRSGGQMRAMTIVSEAGMYEVVIRSDKPDAVTFRRWITAEVLPSIRRTGQYGQPVLDLSDPIAAIEAANARSQQAVEIAKSERAARIEAQAHAKALEAPALAWSHMADSSGDYDVADAAKVLTRDPHIKIGRDRLFSFMAAEGWIFRNRGTSRWKAYQTQVDCGRLTEKLCSPYLHAPTGEMRVPDPTIRVTPKGLAELHKRLGGSGQLALLAEAAS